MDGPLNPQDCKSPHDDSIKNMSGTQSPESNPFDGIQGNFHKIDFCTECPDFPFEINNTPLTDVGRPSLALNFNSDDILTRESLGILPDALLCRDSLSTRGLSLGFIGNILNTSIRESLGILNTSTRESLGILNLSDMDFGRESIGIFNIQNVSQKRQSTINEKEVNLFSFSLDDFDLDNIGNGLKTVKKSPPQPSDQKTVPELLLSTSTTQEKLDSTSLSNLNNAFIHTYSRLFSAASSGSSGVSFYPYFNCRSLEEPSKISSNISQKEIEGSLSNLAITDPFNEAFQISSINNINKLSVSQILSSTSTKHSFASELGNIRNRIQSLPVHLEDNNYFADNMMETRVSNVSVCDDIICRGIEDENDFDDSVFLEARKVVSIIADTSFIEENSFELKEKNILDMIPEPEWTTELDSPNSHTEDKAKSPKWDQGTVSKKIDKMFGLHPVSLEEKLKSKNDSKTTSPLAENTSQNTSKIIQTSPNPDAAENQSKNSIGENISRISRTSQGENQSSGSNNFSQNLSKITQTSDENVSRLLQNLSDILNEKDNLSISQRSEGHRILMGLARLLGDSKSKVSCSSEDSGHSSVHSEDRRTRKDEDRNPPPRVSDGAASNHNEEACQVLDLSCRSKSSSGDMNKKSSVSNSPALNRVSLQYLLKTPNRLSAPNISATSVSSNTSDSRRNAIGTNRSVASNSSNASGQSGNVSTASRHSNISQNKVSFNAVKLRKSKVGVVVSKKGPLRAVLPVEKMVKGSKATGSPERNDASKLGLRSKKTSTPIQEPKLKPMAASTPALRQSTNLNKEQERSPLARQKYTRSFSYQPASTSSSDKPDGSGKSKEKTSSTTKTTKNTSQSKLDVSKPVRRNSITEGTFNSQSDSEGPIRIKRSLSTGKESKIMTALGKVRQSILNSPYYNPRKSVDSVLTEYAKQSKTDLKGYGTELKRLSSVSYLKKPGKENVKP